MGGLQAAHLDPPRDGRAVTLEQVGNLGGAEKLCCAVHRTASCSTELCIATLRAEFLDPAVDVCINPCMDMNRGTMLTVGERLHIARTRAGVGVGEMAAHLNRHRNRVTAYEGAGDDVPLWVIRTYAEVLPNGTTVEWLAAEAGDPPRIMDAVTLRYPDAVTMQPSLWDEGPEPRVVELDPRPAPEVEGAVSGRGVMIGFALPTRGEAA